MQAMAINRSMDSCTYNNKLQKIKHCETTTKQLSHEGTTPDAAK